MASPSALAAVLDEQPPQRNLFGVGQRPTFSSLYPTVGMNTPPLPSYDQRSAEQKAALIEEMFPDLAPTQLVKGVVGAVGDRLMQANQAMPWGGNDPQAIGYDPAAGTIDPSVMVPFATDVAGMATTGALAAPPVSGAAGMGIRAYHGSPHDFDRFSMDKIGTGEGAQAYGHGLYFAENEGVARNYRDALQFKAPVQADGSAPAGPMAIVANAVRDARKYPEPERSDALRRWLDETEAMASGPYAPPDMLQSVKEARRLIDSGEVKPDLGPAGRMYEVDINASPDEFLDWDKPLSEQPPKVREALRPQYEVQPSGDGFEVVARTVAGDRPVVRYRSREAAEDYIKYAQTGDFPASEVQAMVRGGDERGAAEALRAAGIKGIRYKDAGSRKLPSTPAHDVAQEWLRDNGGNVDAALTAYDAYVNSAIPAHLRDAGIDDIRKAIAAGGKPEQQTSNFVVFDDSLIDILKKYGIAGLTAGGAGAAMLGGSQDASAATSSYSTGGRF